MCRIAQQKLACLSVCLSVPLQTFIVPWLLSQFLHILHIRETNSTGDKPAARPLPTYKTAQTQNERTQTSKDSSRLSLRGHCDRLYNVYTTTYYFSNYKLRPLEIERQVVQNTTALAYLTHIFMFNAICCQARLLY